MTQSNELIAGTGAGPKVRLRDSLMALLTWFAADTVAGLAILAATVAVMRNHGARSPAQIIAILPGDFTFLATTTTMTALVALSVLWRYAKRSELKSLASFFPAVPGRIVLWAAASGLIAMAAELALENGIKFGLGIPLPVSLPEAAINPKNWTQLGVAMAGLALIVPLFEEVIFRGYIFGWLKRVMPQALAIVISAALFAAAHGLYATRGGFSGWFGTAEIFVLGVLLGYWAARTGSLIPGCVAHAVINATSFALGFFLPGFYP